MTPEGKVKKEIKQYLDSIGAYYFMPVQMGYGAKTVDFLVCVNGAFVAIEAKRPGKDATAFQKQTIAQVENAGGIAFVATSASQVEQRIGGKF